MPAKRDQIEIMRLPRIGTQSNADSSGEKRHHMGGTGKKKEPPKPADDKPKKPERIPVEDDDYEDGDIATPKRDRTDNDDEPL
jgi:hypothetical protein